MSSELPDTGNRRVLAPRFAPRFAARFALLVALMVCLPDIAPATAGDESAATDAADKASVLVTTTSVRGGSLPQIVTGFGSVQADPSAQQAVMAPASATVARVYVRLGEEIAKGAPLIQLVPTPQTRAAFVQAQSALVTADAQVKHTNELFSEYLATKQQLADARKAQTDAQAALKALNAQGAGGPRTLDAPFRAVVTKLDTSAGALVNEGTSLLELAGPNSLILNIGLVPSQVAGIKVGDTAVIRPVGSAKRLDARVVLRGAVVDPANGLVPVELSLPAGSLLPGQTAAADIATTSIRGFVVPHEAILINNGGHPYIVQVIAGAAKQVLVRVLGGNDGRNVIAGPIDPAAPVVLTGNRQLQNGMRVRLDNSGARGR